MPIEKLVDLELRKTAIAYLNSIAAAARKQAVELAQATKCCRICGLSPPGVPTELRGGKEYACTSCWVQREHV